MKGRILIGITTIAILLSLWFLWIAPMTYPWRLSFSLGCSFLSLVSVGLALRTLQGKVRWISSLVLITVTLFAFDTLVRLFAVWTWGVNGQYMKPLAESLWHVCRLWHREGSILHDYDGLVHVAAGFALLVGILYWCMKEGQQRGTLHLRMMKILIVILLISSGVSWVYYFFPDLRYLRGTFAYGYVLGWLLSLVSQIFEAIPLGALHIGIVGWAIFAILVIRIRLGTDNRIWRITTPLFFPVLAGNTYLAANYYCLVRRLGCGCNQHGFNANDFSVLFFFVLFFVTLGTLLWAARELKWLWRCLYVGFGVPIIYVLCWGGLTSQMWL